MVYDRAHVELDPDALREVRLASEFVHAQAEAGRVIYGVTTGVTRTYCEDEHDDPCQKVARSWRYS